MWSAIKNWLKKNSRYLVALGGVSLGAGVMIVIICAAFPPVLLMISSIGIFGGAPFAFLSSMPFSLAVFSLGAMSLGISFVLSAGSIAVVNQLMVIGAHCLELFRTETKHEEQLAFTGGYRYVTSALSGVTADLVGEDEDDEFFELSRDDVKEKRTQNNQERKREEETSSPLIFRL